MAERTMYLCQEIPAGATSVVHGPRAEDFGRERGEMHLCGSCGIILLRVDPGTVPPDMVVICNNCGAINRASSACVASESDPGHIEAEERDIVPTTADPSSAAAQDLPAASRESP